MRNNNVRAAPVVAPAQGERARAREAAGEDEPPKTPVKRQKQTKAVATPPPVAEQTEDDAWAQCDACQKWRLLPKDHVVDEGQTMDLFISRKELRRARRRRHRTNGDGDAPAGTAAADAAPGLTEGTGDNEAGRPRQGHAHEVPRVKRCVTGQGLVGRRPERDAASEITEPHVS